MNDRSGLLRDLAMAVWSAGVEVVRSDRLVREAIAVRGDRLVVAGETLSLADIRRIAVVGAGKAGAGMAEGLEQALGEPLMAEKSVTGWINVPADCLRPLARIHLHAARPAGRNEPTPEGVVGTSEILRIVAELGPADLCLALISGGASALLPAPAVGVSLADKLAVTRHLSAAGANIAELNTVRKQLSRIKGGGLLSSCGAGVLIALVISDVIGDPLDTIASGPTVADPSTPRDALDVLERFQARQAGIASSVFDFLASGGRGSLPPARTRSRNVVIGNNATAVEGAAREAQRLGLGCRPQFAAAMEGAAEDVGRRLARCAMEMRGAGLACLASGGEPTVTLCDAAVRGLGGRNQQLALAALAAWESAGALAAGGSDDPMALLAGGTDGEDGPTDAAGAVVDRAVVDQARALRLDAHDYLARNDAYSFFNRAGGLVKTGPTHTNVCDLRVVLAR